MTINNGLLKDCPIYTPNLSFKPVSDAFLPLTIIADEYDTSFFDSRPLERNFSIYNDSYSTHRVDLVYRMKGINGEVLQEGSEGYDQLPGERRNIRLEFDLPIIGVPLLKKLESGLEVIHSEKPESGNLQLESGNLQLKSKNSKLESYSVLPSPSLFTLELDLIHDGIPVYSLHKQYKIYPHSSMTHFGTSGKNILFVGEASDYDILKDFTGAALHQGEVTEQALTGTDILILGRNDRGLTKTIQPVLQKYVTSGGFLLVMEQDRETPGELVLSGKTFPNAMISEPDHPVFAGFADEDFANWCTENINVPDGYRPVVNAFEKPVHGDLKVLLECGDGDFGCGGLLWTAMLEYRIGEGHVILEQLDITGRFHELPQARLLLGNILNYASEVQKNHYGRTGLLSVSANKKSGLNFVNLPQITEVFDAEIIVVDPDSISGSSALRLNGFVKNGGKLVVLPMDSTNSPMLEIVANRRIGFVKKKVYQVKSVHPTLCKGITAYDSCHFEKVTYTPSSKSNLVIAESAIHMDGLEKVLVNVDTPWEDLFVNDLAGEQIKQETIQLAKDRPFEELCYCGYLPLGKGGILFCQLDINRENDKLQRIYNRLLANMGAEIGTNLLTYIKEEKDFSIGTFMALPFEKSNNYEAEEAYFSSESYVLNNLGEGVYGWMTRVEKKNGLISIEGSSGKTYFLTLFITSEINRNPQMREDGELPDSSIVPDLLLTANCGMKLFINGRKVFENLHSDGQTEFKVEDIVLDKGINRLAAVCFGGSDDIRIHCCFINKYGDFIKDLKYSVTLD